MPDIPWHRWRRGSWRSAAVEEAQEAAGPGGWGLGSSAAREEGVRVAKGKFWGGWRRVAELGKKGPGKKTRRGEKCPRRRQGVDRVDPRNKERMEAKKKKTGERK